MPVECVSLNDVGACLQVLLMNLGDEVRLRDVQQVIVILNKFLDILEFLTSIVVFFKLVSLDLCAHTAV